jgi:predicted nuclease of restriction endonuclease-like RecB superfamily
MLRKEHALFEIRDRKIFPDQITQRRHAAYLGYAEEMIALYRDGVGKTRRELEQGVERILETDQDCPLRRIKAFTKLLEDASRFDRDKGRQAWKLRKEVMGLAAPSYPLKRNGEALWGGDEAGVKTAIADRLERSWEDIEKSLFTDFIEFHRLVEFEAGYTAKELLNRYNIGQCQAALLHCVLLKVETTDDFGEILGYAKLARLLHQIERLGTGHYRFQFSGPASVLRETTRYGGEMAKFLPSLMRCKGWQLDATIRLKNWPPLRFLLSEKDNLRPLWNEDKSQYDSEIEEALVTKWGKEPRDGWSLFHEADILHERQHVFTPDFVLRHADGREIFMEIAGFWTPEYVAQKRAVLKQFPNARIILAVPEDLLADYEDIGRPLIAYKSRLLIQQVVDALGQVKWPA